MPSGVAGAMFLGWRTGSGEFGRGAHPREQSTKEDVEMGRDRRQRRRRVAALGGAAVAAKKHSDAKQAEQQEASAAAEQAAPPGPREPAGGGGPTPDVLEQLKQLGELHEQNVLTDGEFQREKAKLLGSA